VQLPARIGLITLACRDVERMARLFRALGWPETPESDEHHRTFQCTNGVVIALYAASHYEAELGAPSEGFRGVVLSVNVSSFDEVLGTYEALRGIDDVVVLEAPSEAFWGGGFSWRDPEGNLWDVAWAKGTTIDDRGGVHFP
jgi:predicted lactoylglutathione lyase